MLVVFFLSISCLLLLLVARVSRVELVLSLCFAFFSLLGLRNFDKWLTEGWVTYATFFWNYRQIILMHTHLIIYRACFLNTSCHIAVSLLMDASLTCCWTALLVFFFLFFAIVYITTANCNLWLSKWSSFDWRYMNFFLIFLVCLINPGVNLSLLSRVMSSRLTRGTYNGGLLSTEAGTLARVVADGTITLAGYLGEDKLLNITLLPSLLICIASIAATFLTYNALFWFFTVSLQQMAHLQCSISSIVYICCIVEETVLIDLLISKEKCKAVSATVGFSFVQQVFRMLYW